MLCDLRTKLAFIDKMDIPYILKEKHCNKCIHIIIDTWQLHNDLIINMLTHSHYNHKCVHTMYFVCF